MAGMHRQGAMRDRVTSGGMARTIRTGTMIGPPGAMSAVQIKIADKYQAPTPFSLPIHFSSYLQSPDASMPLYSFGLEEEVLRKADNRRRAEESERRRLEEAARIAAATAAANRPVCMADIMSSGILEPERPGAIAASQADDAATNPASWSLRDFETQATDPFEMAELRTIDDMAELSKVFPTQNPATVTPEEPTPAEPVPMVNGLPSAVTGQTSTLATATASASTIDTRQQQPLAGERSAAAHRPPAGGVALPVPAPSPRDLSPRLQHRGSDEAAPVDAAAGSSDGTSSAPVPKPRPRPRTSVPSPPMTTAAPVAPQRSPRHHAPASQPVATTTVFSGSPAPGQALHPAADATPTLVAPQALTAVPLPGVPSRHHAPIPTAVPISNPEPPPSYSASVPASAGLPPVSTATSTPGDAFPPPYPMQPPQPPQEQRLPQRVAPPPPYMTSSREPASGGSASGYRQSDYSLPNVYSKLKRAEKRLVEQLEQMGFPQDRLSRAVQRLGCDQAKVLEFMFQINKFGESPHNFPPDSAETALINNELSEEKALHSLQLVFELREMGFQEKVIHAALKEAKNKRDDAVDYLISHT